MGEPPAPAASEAAPAPGAGAAAKAEFTPLEVPAGNAFTDKYLAGCLSKWDLQRGMRYAHFRAGKAYHKMAGREFVGDFLGDARVQEAFRVLTKGGQWEPLGDVADFDFEAVPATLTNMEFFDRLETADPPITRKEGTIFKCFENFVNGIQISDLLRDMLLNEESENAALYGEEERAQFLFLVLKHLSLGGAMCQFEDKVTAYLTCAKRCYKELLTVFKNQKTEQIEVGSAVYRVTRASGARDLFPSESERNFCYLAFDPFRRVCKVWYHASADYW